MSPTGVPGVRKQNNKWIAMITKNRLFDNFNDAVNARKTAEEKLFGEFRYIYPIRIL